MRAGAAIASGTTDASVTFGVTPIAQRQGHMYSLYLGHCTLQIFDLPKPPLLPICSVISIVNFFVLYTKNSKILREKCMGRPPPPSPRCRLLRNTYHVGTLLPSNPPHAG